KFYSRQPDLAGFVACPHLGRLTLLDIQANQIGDAGAQALASASHMNGLRTLWFQSIGIGPDGTAALPRSPGSAPRVHRDLPGNKGGDEGVRELANSPHLGQLAMLSLGHCVIRPRSLALLAASDALVGLAALQLSGTVLGPEGATALADSPLLARLER